MLAEVVVSHDQSMLQDSPPPKVTPSDCRRAALYVAATSLDATPDRPAAVSRCRELLEALGLAPTTTPTGGTR